MKPFWKKHGPEPEPADEEEINSVENFVKAMKVLAGESGSGTPEELEEAVNDVFQANPRRGWITGEAYSRMNDSPTLIEAINRLFELGNSPQKTELREKARKATEMINGTFEGQPPKGWAKEEFRDRLQNQTLWSDESEDVGATVVEDEAATSAETTAELNLDEKKFMNALNSMAKLWQEFKQNPRAAGQSITDPHDFFSVGLFPLLKNPAILASNPHVRQRPDLINQAIEGLISVMDYYQNTPHSSVSVDAEATILSLQERFLPQRSKKSF